MFIDWLAAELNWDWGDDKDNEKEKENEDGLVRGLVNLFSIPNIEYHKK